MFKTFTSALGGEVDIAVAMIVSVRKPLSSEPRGQSVIATGDGKFHVVQETLAEVRAMLNDPEASA